MSYISEKNLTENKSSDNITLVAQNPVVRATEQPSGIKIEPAKQLEVKPEPTFDQYKIEEIYIMDSGL